jgi:hypothetical protein
MTAAPSPGLAWAFVSGIEANTTGTGRFMQHLQAAILAERRYDGTIVYCPAGQTLSAEQIGWLAQIPHLVIFHPQMLGVRETLDLMTRRAAAGRPTHLYLLDNFFFCLKSYNHLDHEYGPCLRCVGPGRGLAALEHGCRPWPAADPLAAAFIARLYDLVSQGAVRLFTQNRKQSELARAHFGPTAVITYAGLWCADWTAFVDAFLATGRAEGEAEDAAPGYDVVYHGSRDPAKGIGWVLATAALTPELSYLVPLDRGAATIAGPANVTIQPMRWDGGLHEAVRRARLVLAPSLWSSPCEGALIKNIVVARAPAVVDIASAFSSEIPPAVLLRLPQAPAAAAAAVREAQAAAWRPDPATRLAWVRDFKQANADVAARLIPSRA